MTIGNFEELAFRVAIQAAPAEEVEQYEAALKTHPEWSALDRELRTDAAALMATAPLTAGDDCADRLPAYRKGELQTVVRRTYGARLPAVPDGAGKKHRTWAGFMARVVVGGAMATATALVALAALAWYALSPAAPRHQVFAAADGPAEVVVATVAAPDTVLTTEVASFIQDGRVEVWRLDDQAALDARLREGMPYGTAVPIVVVDSAKGMVTVYEAVRPAMNALAGAHTPPAKVSVIDQRTLPADPAARAQLLRKLVDQAAE